MTPLCLATKTMMAISSLKKPRIRIKVAAGDDDNAAGKKVKKKKKTKKATPATEDAVDASSDEGNNGDDEKTPAQKRKRKRSEPVKEYTPKVVSRKRTKKNPPTETVEDGLQQGVSNDPKTSSTPGTDGLRKEPENGDAIGDDPAAIYLDVASLEKERESLDGTFKSARAMFTKRGAWQLPQAVGEGRFSQVAKRVLDKMHR